MKPVHELSNTELQAEWIKYLPAPPCEHAMVDSITQACTHCHASREQVSHDLRKRLGPSLNLLPLSTDAGHRS